LNIVVLAGGYSPERDVSLSSGSLVANALMKTGHKVLLLDVYEGIESKGPYEDLFRSDKVYNHQICHQEPDLEELKNRCNNGNSLIGKNVIELCKYADIVFLGLHRRNRRERPIASDI